NPPRYMHLVEVIPGRVTDPKLLEGLEAFLTSTLGKGVVFAKDTPNFIGNRIGVFSILSTMYHTTQFKLGFDAVDALTGPAIGRPKSATYRTADVVGLDTMAHVIKTMADTLPHDPWHEHFKASAWLSALIEKGALGAKVGAGFYRKAGKEIQVLDLAKRDYRASEQQASDEVAAILGVTNPAGKFAKLRESKHPRRSSCGRAFATCSTTPPITWKPSPKLRATWISRFAGVTAGSSDRSKPGRLWAGNRSPSGSP